MENNANFKKDTNKDKEGFLHRIGDKIERMGEKISEKAPSLGKKIHDLGDRIEHSRDNKK